MDPDQSHQNTKMETTQQDSYLSDDNTIVSESETSEASSPRKSPSTPTTVQPNLQKTMIDHPDNKKVSQLDQPTSVAETNTRVKSGGRLVPGLSVSSRNLKYTVKLKGKKVNGKTPTKDILKGVTAHAKPGRLLAIMGPSGSGKTSLLNILGGKMQATSGDLLLGGVRSKRTDMLRVSSYVEQDDQLLSTLTVKETLVLAARLQLPSDRYTNKEKEQVALDVIDSLHISRAKDTWVGSPSEGIIGVSGGERKRCAVGVALVKNPQILLCDEPTSGLDSMVAWIVIKTLRELAQKENRTVIVTIHQPSSDVFNLFDDLLILQEGNVVYAGAADDAVPYFAKIGFVTPKYTNPADYFFMHALGVSPEGLSSEETGILLEDEAIEDQHVLEELSLEEGVPTYRQQSLEQHSREEMLSKAWKESQNLQVLKQTIKADEGNAGKSVPSEFFHSASISQMEQFALLSGRALKQMIRNPMRSRARMGQAVIFSLILALIYLQLGNDQKGLQDRAGAMFFITANLFMSGTMGVVTTFANERATFVREYQGGLYSVLSYFGSKIMIETPFFLLTASIYMTIVYWALGLQNDAEKFLFALAVALALQLCSNSLGILAASIFSKIEIAVAVLPLIILPFFIFSGFVLNSESIPVYFKWVEPISPIRYGFVALAINEFTDLNVTCADDELIRLPTCPMFSPNGTMIQPPTNSTSNGVCRFESGDEFLDSFNFEEWLTPATCIYVLIGLSVGLSMLAYGFLYRLGNARSRAS